MNPSILLINDMAGYGKVALSCMLPILSHMKFQVYNLPTALVSNTLDYGLFDILETTDYMNNTLSVWEKLGFSFDAVSIGFLVSERQVDLLSEYCRVQNEKGIPVFLDPIMGDDGKLYNGMDEQTVVNMRRMSRFCQLMMPNMTEAAFLTGRCIGQQHLNQQEAKELLLAVHQLNQGSVVITSMNIEEQMTVGVYDAADDSLHWLPYTAIPVRFPGTGDIFSSLLIGQVLHRHSLVDATLRAMDTTKRLIALNRNNVDTYKGIPIEQYLEDIPL